MTNLAIPTAPQLPAHLSKFADIGFSLNESIVGGMSSGGHPSIGIKQAKFRLREGANEEVVQSFTLDVIIVNANKHLSKVFYLGAYTGEEGKAPDCFSDNGIAPSAQAQNPQSASCAMCPHNAWGSKISPSGAKIKACSDYKKLAVVLADDPERNVYELRIPGASLKELNVIMTKLIQNRVPIPAIVFQLSFDAQVDYPKIVFKPLSYVDERQAQIVEGWINSAEAKQVVGANDVPLAGNVSPTPQAQPQIAQSAPEPTKEDPMAFLNTGAPAPAAQPAKRGRPPKTPGELRAQAVKEPQQMSLDLPGAQAPAQATPINPPSTDANLDALLAGIM